MTKHPQLNLFNEATLAPTDPLLGLGVLLPDACKQCGSREATIGPGAGPHLASLHCQCGVHFRGWVGARTHAFLTEIVAKFGRPETPIEIRRQRSIGFIEIGKVVPGQPP